MKKYLLIIIFIFTGQLFAQEQGVITGTVIDHDSQKPVNDAIVSIIGTKRYVMSGNDGRFEFDTIPLGTYQLTISKVGYDRVVKTDIVILSARPTDVRIELISKSYRTDTIDVEARYFQKSSDENTSSYNLDFEEVRRAPGSAEDVSRMVQNMPGVSSGNDQRNDLIVRGGSPSENYTSIDGIAKYRI